MRLDKRQRGGGAVGHAPLVETRCHKDLVVARQDRPDVRQLVGRRVVLRRPVVRLHRAGVVHLRPRIQLLHRRRRALLAADGMAGATDDQPVARRRRRVTHRPGRRVGRDVHAAGEVARHLVGHAVGAAGLEPGEEAAAVQDRNAGRQHALLGVHVELVAGGGAHMQRQPVALARNLLHPNALRQPAAALVEFDDQAVQQRHRIELRLMRQAGRRRGTGTARRRRRPTPHPARRPYTPPVPARAGADALLGLRVGVGVLALHREAVRLAVLDQPLLALAVALARTAVAIFGPCLPTIFDNLVPCSRLIFAVVLPVAPAPAVSAPPAPARPCRPVASSTAVISPVRPAPTTATSAERSRFDPADSAVTAGQLRSASHSDVMAVPVPAMVDAHAPKPRDGRNAVRPADLRSV